MELKWTRDEMRMNSGMKWEIGNWNEMGNWQLERNGKLAIGMKWEIDNE